jgi:hypothetical protein
MSVIHPAGRCEYGMVDTEVVYDESFGVWSSPNVANLIHPVPPYDMEIPANIRISEFRKPRWLSNVYPYVAFWPKSVSFTGPIFARLDISDKTLPVIRISHIFYSLPDDMITSWRRLEIALVGLATFLISESRTLKHMAVLGFLPLPSECGYASTHKEERFVRHCAYKSREAFVGLSAFCSFVIANNMDERDRMREEPSWSASCRLKKGVHPQWLQDLQQSFVCNFSPGFRVGAYVNGYLSTWAKAFPAFQIANVPLWIWWGLEPSIPRDKIVMKLYLPTVQEVNQAKLMSKVPFPQPRKSAQNFDDDNYPLMNFDDGNYQHGEGYQPAGINSFSSTILLPNIASAPAPNRGSFQLRGEDLPSFINRVRVMLSGSIQDEDDDDDRASRAETEKAAEVQRLNDTLTEWSETLDIFEWIDAGGGHRLRTLVPREERQSRWSLTTPDTRWYHGLIHQFSILVHPSTAETDYFDPTSTTIVEEGNTKRIQQRQPQLSADPVPQQADRQSSSVIQPRTMVDIQDRDIYAEDVKHLYGHLVSDSSVVSRSLKHILFYRYGFKPQVPYTTDSRMRELETNNSECRVVVSAMDRLGLKTFLEDDLHEAVVDMYNFIICNPTRLFAFDPLWDLHPSFWGCVVDHPVFQYCKISDDIHLIGVRDRPLHKQFYLLMIPHACTVLQVFREDHRGVLAIARSLIAWGIPFHTVRCHLEKPIGLGVMEKKSFGLGFRHNGHKFNDAEYAIYETKKRDILKSRYGRVAVMAGGILWRLSKDVVDHKTVTRGPTPSYMQEGTAVGSLGNFHLVDDQLSATEEDIICGVYHMSGMIHPLLVYTSCLSFLQNKRIRLRRYRGGQNTAPGRNVE